MKHAGGNASSPGSATPEFGPRLALLPRLAGAVQRRARHAMARWAKGPSRPPVEAAYDWLLRTSLANGVPLLAGDALACPGVTGAAIATATAYGDDETAQRWTKWLLSVQDHSGAFRDSAGEALSLVNTGQAIRGLLAVGQDSLRCDSQIERACEFVLGCFEDSGQLRRDATSAGGLAAWGSPALQLSCLPPVLQAARRFAHDGWVGRIQAIVRHYKRSFDLTRWDSVSHLFATGVGALAELASIDPGLRGPAADAMELAAGAQQSDGSLPALPRGGWCSTSGCLGMAGVWYRLGQKVHADRAWDAIAARQLPNGGFVGSYGRGARYFPRREVAWGALQFLDVTLLRVAATFAEGDAAYAEISTDDARLKTVRRWSARLPDNASIADVGCGRGRYLQHLATWLPRARLVGVDLSERWCREMPRGVEARAGSLLRIPAADGEFDAVLAIESLEHSLLPRRALREMFRVLRPGGRLLIIDKDAAAQPLSKHEPWEQWFAPRELSGWLSEGCQEVAVRSINLPKGGGKQVYVAWSGVRRGQTERRRAA